MIVDISNPENMDPVSLSKPKIPKTTFFIDAFFPLYTVEDNLCHKPLQETSSENANEVWKSVWICKTLQNVVVL